MSIWNKVLAWLIGVAGVGLVFMAMWTVKIHKVWAESYVKHDRQLKQVEAANAQLADVDIRQLRLALHKVLVDRQRAWFHCEPKIKVGREEGTAEVTLTVDQPEPHGIASKTVLYAFEEADARKKGQYLGEYIATNSDDKKVTLVPTSRLSERQLDRIEKLSKRKGPWVLYESMPRDNHEILAGLDEKELKSLLPAATASEYLKDGRPAAKDAPKDRIQDGKYVRKLRDFNVLLGAEQKKRLLLNNSIRASEWDKQLLAEALADAKKQEETVKKDVRVVGAEKKASERDRDVVASYRGQIEQKLAAIESLVARLIETNQAMAGQIAKSQLQAAQRIDARTRVMAQSDAERR